MSEKETDIKLLIEYLEENGSITPLEALSELGIYRLSGRIYDLRQMGYQIKTDMVPVKAKRRNKVCQVASYSLVGECDG
jgi:hypothetical protein